MTRVEIQSMLDTLDAIALKDALEADGYDVSITGIGSVKSSNVIKLHRYDKDDVPSMSRDESNTPHYRKILRQKY